MADGLTAREVARRLGISRRTVEGHLRALREMTGTRSMGELCAVGVAEGWVMPGRRLPGRTAGDPGPPAGAGVLSGGPEGAGTASAGRDGAGAPSAGRDAAGAPSAGRSCPETNQFLDDLTTMDLSPLASPAASEPEAGHGHPRGRRRRGRPTVMTPERVAEARQLLPTHSMTDIARKLGVSRATLYAHRGEIAGAGAAAGAQGSAGHRKAQGGPPDGHWRASMSQSLLR
jgi:DNA-binding CsgD family transcriptional regulator